MFDNDENEAIVRDIATLAAAIDILQVQRFNAVRAATRRILRDAINALDAERRNLVHKSWDYEDTTTRHLFSSLTDR